MNWKANFNKYPQECYTFTARMLYLVAEFRKHPSDDNPEIIELVENPERFDNLEGEENIIVLNFGAN